MAIQGAIERGSIVLLDFSPQSGNEQAGRRPGIVLSDGLIDPTNSFFAIIVPISNTGRHYPFHVQVPPGITIKRHHDSELTGYVYTDQVKSLDLNHRNAQVIGKIDEHCIFYKTIVTYVRSMLA
ncbi:type II toxin-antitoxin system PemK/MazF family toxin [Paenibacillus campi]|uniref:type II toxin-antitoxin system PemK/MazF family toxin n=1 Tax=Paenibacillus campi TaxID=3106031 RepID=UPI002AFE1617|nr:type II toxin-antitoxin system PemK/MazF family toxin [Paenibacillus sp. SGZ-1009]